jgi:hypothetical protein
LIIGITASFLPVLITVLVAVFSGNNQHSNAYIINAIPPSICVPNDTNVAFYSTTFVNIVFTSIYTILLIIIIYFIHKHKDSTLRKDNTLENKLTILFIVNVLIESTVFINSAIHSALKNVFIESLRVYFECEAIGHTGNNSLSGCDRTEFETYSFATYSMLYHVILGLLPIGPLIYVINWKCGKSAKNIHSASDGEVIENKAFNFNST